MDEQGVEAGLDPFGRPQAERVSAPDWVKTRSTNWDVPRPSSPDEDVRAYATGVKRSSMNLLLESKGNGLAFRP